MRLKLDSFAEDPEDPLIGEKFLAWRRRFEACMAGNAWDPAQALVQLHYAIAYPASQHLTGLKLDNLGVTETLDALAKAFMSPESGQTARADFKAARMAKAGENVLGWHTRVRRLFLRAYPHREPEMAAELIEQYVEGLYPPSLMEYVMDRQPRTYTAARDLAEAKAATLAAKKRLAGLEYPQTTASASQTAPSSQGRNGGGRGAHAIGQPAAAAAAHRGSTEGATKKGPGDKSQSGASTAAQSAAADKGDTENRSGRRRFRPKCGNCNRWGHQTSQCEGEKKKSANAVSADVPNQDPPDVGQAHDAGQGN